MGLSKDKWVWMPHAGHWILSDRCMFHLNTYVGGYIVSTVGEAKKRLGGIPDDRPGKYETVGAGPQCYETMVFKAKKSDNKCCKWTAKSWHDLECKRYMTDEEAIKGHMKLCKKWSEK